MRLFSRKKYPEWVGPFIVVRDRGDTKTIATAAADSLGRTHFRCELCRQEIYFDELMTAEDACNYAEVHGWTCEKTKGVKIEICSLEM